MPSKKKLEPKFHMNEWSTYQCYVCGHQEYSDEAAGRLYCLECDDDNSELTMEPILNPTTIGNLPP